MSAEDAGRTIAGLWCDVLGVTEADPDQDFVELGGDSLRAIQLASRINEALGIDLAATAILKSRSYARIVSLVDDLPATSTEARDRGAEIGPGESPPATYRLTSLQEGLLFHSLVGGDERPYWNQVAWELEGTLEPEQLRQAWEGAVRAHAILRTGFLWEGVEHPLQCVWQDVAVPFVVEDWTGAGGSTGRRLEAHLQADLERGYELARPPLMRLAVFRVGARRWQLVWSYHHVLLDGWSAAGLLVEVWERYQAAVEGRTPGLVARRPYRDYIRWLEQQDPSRAERYWRDRLDGFEEPTSPHQGTTGERGSGQVQRSLTERQTQRLERYARRQRVTMGTLVHGAWALLLAGHAGADEVVFGSTSSGRPAELRGSEEMIGLIVNTLPVRVAVRTDDDVGSWLQALQEQLVENRRYEYSPLAKVQGWSQIEPGRRLFESIVAYENYPSGDPHATTGLKVVSQQRRESTDYALSLAVHPGRQLRLALNYRRAAFDEWRATRLLEQVERLLTGIARSTHGRLLELPLMTHGERRQQAEWNRTGAALPSDRTVAELFEEQVRRTPDRVAVTGVGGELSYAELNRRANRLGRRLRELGVGPEVLVGICANRSSEMVVGLLGILKAGGAYVPLDAGYPGERLRFMAEETEAEVLLVQRGLEGWVPENAAVVWLGDAWEDYPDGDLEPAAGPANLAYVIYTSGSTGQPKGVMVEQRSLVNLVAWHQRAYGISADDRGSWLAAEGFDASVWELWPYLLAGASVAVGSDRARERLAAWLAAQDVTVGFVATPLAEGLLQEEGLRLPRLRYLLTGGDRLGRRPPAGLSFDVVNHYGTTENTVVATAGRVSPEGAGAPSIGRPIQNTHVYVLDRWGAQAPTGIAGELHIGGVGVARGYLKRPELTDERFVVSPFGNGRLYRTGDLGRWLPDGELEFLGRLDEQVKILGNRIELGEVEACLREQAGVREAVVVAREDAPGQRMRLVGYVVAETGTQVDWEEIEAGLRKRLPDYMVPGVWMELAKLPLTVNGKLDRRGLPAPERVFEGYEEPHTQAEATLCRIWAEVLGVGRVGIHDDFLELGGDSIASIRVVSRAREAGLDLRPSDLFRQPTVAALAGAAGSRRGRSADHGDPSEA